METSASLHGKGDERTLKVVKMGKLEHTLLCRLGLLYVEKTHKKKKRLNNKEFVSIIAAASVEQIQAIFSEIIIKQ